MGRLKVFVFTAHMACFLCTHTVYANSSDIPVRVAVAANFKPTLQQLINAYGRSRPQANIRVSSASSGVLYAQILRGAPFDLFLSADSKRPKLLQQQGLVEADRLSTYALGQLVLWAPGLAELNVDGIKAYSGKIALANPTLAPFGRASRQTLLKLGLWKRQKNTLIMANNVSQVAQMIDIGAVPMGLVSKSLVRTIGKQHIWQVPDSYYQAIVQQMVILNIAQVSEQHSENVSAFYRYILSPLGQDIIRQNGYLLPVASAQTKGLARAR
ncbi:MAG: molybdate transport system substrate-binding protein [Paraglaciecola sp.]|jgi:molybdate transport system substrate-binding protein